MSMKALVTTDDHQVVVKDHPKPAPADGEILVKVHYAAQNPTDWKSVATRPEGRIPGCDFSGTVEDPNGSKWQKGQRVAGWVHGCRADPERGAYAEFLVTEAELVFPVPESVDLRDAATISLAVATAVQALFQRQRLPSPIEPASEPKPVLIYGGATSVGLYAIQLAKLAGLRVIATGSDEKLLKSFGADDVVSYKDDDWPSKVRELTNDSLEHAFDCIAEKGTTRMIAEAMSSTKPSHIIALLPVTSKDISEDAAQRVKVESTLAYSVFGRPLPNLAFENTGSEPTPQDKEYWERYLELLPELLASGKLKPNPVKEMGGIEEVARGFQLQQDGKVRAEKLVYKLA